MKKFFKALKKGSFAIGRWVEGKFDYLIDRFGLDVASLIGAMVIIAFIALIAVSMS